MADRTLDGGWHLDRKVPISLIIGILINFGGLIWIVSQGDARVAANEKAIARLENLTDNMPADLATMQQQISNIEQSVNRIERSLGGYPSRDERGGGR